jgi:hypothetical protein
MFSTVQGAEEIAPVGIVGGWVHYAQLGLTQNERLLYGIVRRGGRLGSALIVGLLGIHLAHLVSHLPWNYVLPISEWMHESRLRLSALAAETR